jgi:hypothetical protein
MITNEILFSKNISEFEDLLKQHELLLSRILKRQTIQSLLFQDHKGAVKSLGGWGGDFVLMTNHSGKEDFVKYITKKGYDIYYSFDDIVL